MGIALAIRSYASRHGHQARMGRVQKRVEVECRLHHLRDTFATKLAESGVSASTMLALMGHMIRFMLERYSVIKLLRSYGAGGRN